MLATHGACVFGHNVHQEVRTRPAERPYDCREHVEQHGALSTETDASSRGADGRKALAGRATDDEREGVRGDLLTKVAEAAPVGAQQVPHAPCKPVVGCTCAEGCAWCPQCMHGSCEVGVNLRKSGVMDSEVVLVEQVLECEPSRPESVKQRYECNGASAGPSWARRATGGGHGIQMGVQGGMFACAKPPP